MKKNLPLIFDTLANGGLLPEDVRRVRPLLFQAKHFVLDEQACNFVSRLSNDRFLMKKLREFAIPPFEKMALTHIYGPDVEGVRHMHMDEARGAYQSLTLWDRGEWKTWVARADGSDLAAIPGWNVNNPDGSVSNAEALAREEAAGRGSAERVLASLAVHRTIIDAFFLLMLQPKHIQINFNEPRRSFHQGKPVRYFARSEIKIDLTDVQKFKRGFYSGAHGSPRWHEVRAHFVHIGGDRACTHAWEPVESEDGRKRWLCSCGRKRIERRYPNGRGDASKGFVRQQYAITASDRFSCVRA